MSAATRKVLFEATTVAALGAIVLDGVEHEIHPVRAADFERIHDQGLQGELEAGRKEPGNPTAMWRASLALLQLALPSVKREQLLQLEGEVFQRLALVVNQALAERNKALQEELERVPFASAS